MGSTLNSETLWKHSLFRACVCRDMGMMSLENKENGPAPYPDVNIISLLFVQVYWIPGM